MPFEYKMLAVMTLLFLFAWLPSSLGKYKSYGTRWLLSNRDPMAGRELVPWGARAERAYANLKDYFPGFVVAILLLGATNRFDYLTAWASALYVIGRIGHYLFYVLGNVQLRFVTFVLSMSCNVFLLIKVFL